ncbi:hypothetical protein Cch01nite_36550 [Cellulomonas chitinilytica]|uniref:Serine protease n=1 Tax=Cellulomonas chitinilytica TaxID=398759 RepID=A0A919P3T8_9CELL|nr:hypothetical protein [Cellulomonas chitinilytica]GIG22931.1 hypothetical protein Cch01nite_36550 [Cellulomonas chitinilytica]
MRTRKSFVVAAFLGLVLTAAVPQAAVASPTPPGPTTADPAKSWPAGVDARFIQNQQDLDALKTWIIDQPGVASSGYVDQVHDSAHRAVTLLWHGTDELQRRAVKEAGRRGITVTVEQRSHSLPEIVAASNAILDRADELAASGFVVQDVVGVQAGVDGIVVEGTAVAPAATSRSQAAPSAAAATTAAPAPAAVAASITDLPVTFVSDVSTAVASGRNSDTSPFYAGGYMISGSEVCSAGFALKIGGSNKITTARHCIPSGSWKARSGTASYGSISKNASDGALSVLTGSGAGRTFTAGIGSTNTLPVVGYSDVGINDYVCTSGGNSGQHCGVKVTAMSVSFNDGTGHGNVSTIKAVADSGISVIQGDSGGPVFINKGAGVSAVGMIQGLQNGSTSGCGTVVDSGNLCSKTVLFSSIHTVLLYGGLSATLVTSS